MMLERFSAGSASMIRLVQVMLHTKMNRKTTFQTKENRTTSDQVGSDPIIEIDIYWVGSGGIGSGRARWSGRIRSDRRIQLPANKKKKTHTKDLFIAEARAFLHLLLLIAGTLKQLGHPIVRRFDPVGEHHRSHAVVEVLR